MPVHQVTSTYTVANIDWHVCTHASGTCHTGGVPTVSWRHDAESREYNKGYIHTRDISMGQSSMRGCRLLPFILSLKLHWWFAGFSLLLPWTCYNVDPATCLITVLNDIHVYLFIAGNGHLNEIFIHIHLDECLCGVTEWTFTTLLKVMDLFPDSQAEAN